MVMIPPLAMVMIPLLALTDGMLVIALMPLVSLPHTAGLNSIVDHPVTLTSSHGTLLMEAVVTILAVEAVGKDAMVMIMIAKWLICIANSILMRALVPWLLTTARIVGMMLVLMVLKMEIAPILLALLMLLMTIVSMMLLALMPQEFQRVTHAQLIFQVQLPQQ